MLDVSMLNVVVQNAWVLHHIIKDEVDESLPLLACNFPEIFKGKQIPSNHGGIQNVSSDACYEVAHYQVPSKKKACVRCARITADVAV